MSGGLPAAVGAVVSDVLSVCGVPGGSAVGAVLSAKIGAVMARRRDNAREILLEELRKGEAFVDQAASIDEWVAVLLRYSRAAQEGAARLNLRLMAKVIAWQAQAGPLVADEFLAWADVLASLRREEVILLGVMVFARREVDRMPDLKPDKRPGLIREILVKRLVPSVFGTNSDFAAAGLSLGRTGLVNVSAGWGAMLYTPATAVRKLEALVSFQDALREEGVDLGGDHGGM